MRSRELRWQGWGPADRHRPLSAPEQHWLGELLGIDAWNPTPAPALEEIELPPSALAATEARRLEALLAVDRVSQSRRDRIQHALGQSYHDLLRYRSGHLGAAPDAVLWPQSESEVAAVLAWAAGAGAAVVPCGGGTSVVGGVSAGRGVFPTVVTLDLTRLNRLLAVDPVDRLARAEAGIDGPALERSLARQGLTLGHFPQSFEYSTLGGWIAARGAGQQSNRYGGASHWFAGARLVTPRGSWETEPFPASAAGPRLADLVVGSEGALGVITEATVHVRPLPAARWERAWLFPDFESGVAAVRAASQAELEASMLRLSDPDETRFQGGFARAGQPPGLAERLLRRWLDARGFGDRPALLLVGIEGEHRRVNRDATALARLLRRHGAQALGARPAAHWRSTRFDAPFLRDPLLDLGLGVDTLETAAPWSVLGNLYAAVRGALAAALEGTGGQVMAHLSHSYPDGASLYFTFVFRRDPADPIAQWWRIKGAATEAIRANGGTISHHHGVGEDHRPWLAGEKGPAALALLHEAKAALDPDGRMNPGKLLDPKPRDAW